MSTQHNQEAESLPLALTSQGMFPSHTTQEIQSYAPHPEAESALTTGESIGTAHTMHLAAPADIHHSYATAPPPSESSYNPAEDAHPHWQHNQHRHSGQLVPAPLHPDYVNHIVSIAQDAINQTDANPIVEQNLPNPPQAVSPSQYCMLGFAVNTRLRSVLSGLESDALQLRIVISHDDTLTSIKKQISNHRAVFDRKGYPSWSKDILGSGREYSNHSWCHLVFRGALASEAQSMRSDFVHLLSTYTKIQRALDSGAVQRLQDYIQVLKALDQMKERVKRYGMCSTEYYVNVRNGFSRRIITAGPGGCNISETPASSLETKDRTLTELVVWPAPSSGQNLPRSPQIVKLQVAKEIVASKFRDLQLMDVEDLGLEKLENSDLRLLLNTPRFANGAALLAQKFYLGNHITDGFMSNLARHWLLSDAERNERAFKHLLLLSDQTSIDLVRVMMTAADIGTADQIRMLCWEISAKNEVLECCEAIAKAAVPSGITARARLCIACLGPAVLNAVRNATRIRRGGPTPGSPARENHDAEALKLLLGFAEIDVWERKLNAYLHLKEIGSTNQSAALHAEQVASDEDAQKLEMVTRYLKQSSMKNQIVTASRSLQDLEMYVAMLNSEPVSKDTSLTLLMRLLSTAGYRRVAQLHVPVESGLDFQNVAAWMLSGPSEGVCMSGEVFLRRDLKDRNPAPLRDHTFLRGLTGQARLDSHGRWEFHQGFPRESIAPGEGFWSFLEKATQARTPVWKNLLDIDCSERSHAHISEQIYFHMGGSELPNARGLSLVKLERDGVGDLVGRGLTITPRIAMDIWHLGYGVYYSMSRGRLWEIETDGSSYYARQVVKLVGNFTEMSRGGLENMTIS